MKKMALINTKLEKNNIYIIELNNAKKRNPLSLELIKSLQNEFDYIKKKKTSKSCYYSVHRTFILCWS